MTKDKHEKQVIFQRIYMLFLQMNLGCIRFLVFHMRFLDNYIVNIARYQKFDKFIIPLFLLNDPLNKKITAILVAGQSKFGKAKLYLSYIALIFQKNLFQYHCFYLFYIAVAPQHLGMLFSKGKRQAEKNINPFLDFNLKTKYPKTILVPMCGFNRIDKYFDSVFTQS